MEYQVENGVVTFFIEEDPSHHMFGYPISHPKQLFEPEGPTWLDIGRMAGHSMQRLPESLHGMKMRAINRKYPNWQEKLRCYNNRSTGRKRINLLALGDVGGTLLTGLVLLGGDVVQSIGICDINPQMMRRYELEMNQIAYPWAYEALPAVEAIEANQLFDCDVFIFCASKGVPPLDTKVQDVRMAQLKGNAALVREYARQARICGFQGLFAVVSDPVDLLCRCAFIESNRNENGALDFKGLRPEQVQGYGLGVMNARAAYYAKQEQRFSQFLREGRAYGPHGQDLVIANSIAHYDDELSRELTRLAVEANLRTRETGFKPYIAPALSSGAISILLTLRGEWHYSAVPLGGVYWGCKNRYTPYGVELEQLQNIPDDLFDRIQQAYGHLQAMDGAWQ